MRNTAAGSNGECEGCQVRRAKVRFGDVGAETAFHDHRYPLAVFPFGDVGTATSDVLYEMPWQRRVPTEGSTVCDVLVVRDSAPWAILDHQHVWHAVHSKPVHFSVLLSDATDPPTRPDRLVSRALSVADTREAQRMVARALAAAFRRSAAVRQNPNGVPKPVR